jgi:hypothetical protein
MGSFGQFFFLLLPGLILAGGVVALMLHRNASRTARGRRRRRLRLTH